MADPATQSVFENGLESNFRSSVKMVEAVIATLGVQPDTHRINSPDGHPAWGFRRGSAAVYVFVRRGKDANDLQVVSPVVKLPPADTLLAFYRRLLELNANSLFGVGFGVRGDDVVVSASRSTTDLDVSEVAEMIRRVGEYADRFDDELAAAFGARRHCDA